MTLLLKNVKIYGGDGVFLDANIVVEDGNIEAIVKDYKKYLGKVDEVIDGRGYPVIPGGIDVHAHIYDPDYTHHEDWETGTLSAVYGGITTVFDMPLRMFVDDVDKLKLKIDDGLKHAYINFGIHAGMMKDENLHNIPSLAREGVIGYKVFTLKPWGASDKAILEIMNLVKEFDGVVIVHAEDDALIDLGIERVKHRHDPLAHHEARSDLAEAVAVTKVGWYAKTVGAHVHIAHVTSKIEAETISFLKSHGVRITAETCPQYLYFTREDVKRLGNYLKCAPSLKTREDVLGLWKALADGVIDAIASDHAPSPREEKEVDVWDAWGGLPVIELIIPLAYTFGVKKNILSFDRFIEVVSTNPAKITRLYPRKGVLTPGSDADIVVLSTSECKAVKAEELHHKVDWNPFEGVEMCGWPLHVIVNGKPVIVDKELVGKPGLGEYVGIYLREYIREKLARVS